MTQATSKDYWISPNALYIELNALSNPDYIQASCVSGAQILVYVKDIIGYDAGHNYRRWSLQAVPTVFNTHNEKYVYAAIPRDMTLTSPAWIVFPSELLDIYGKNEKEEQIGDEKYYYINLQGIITSSGDNGTEQRDWKQRISTGYLSSDEAISAIGGETEWYKYSSVDEIVTFLKNLTMKEGTTFKTLFANFINVKPKGSLAFEGQGSLTGIANSATPDTNTDKIVTPNFVSDRAISKLHDDTAQGLIKFRKGLEVGDYLSGAQGGFIDGEGYAELLSIIVRGLISSANYKSGFDGEGYRLWNDEDGLSNLEIDKLTVRQIMTVFELIIDRIRAVGGQIVVSAANGKIKAVEDTGEAYKIEFEGDNYFQAHDLMRCQIFNGEEIRGYWVEVAASYSDYIVVSKSEFSGTITIGDKTLTITEPKEGDEVVLVGNTTNSKRQNLISISATEDGEPRIDVLDGVKAKNFDGALRARLGNLDGITDDWFPLDNQPHGNGLYADNVYLRGSFLLTTGEDIKTKFDIMEGKISSSIESVRKDFMQDKGYLNNPTFGDGMSHWTAENTTTFFFLGNKWIWANDNVLTKKGDGASLTTDDGRVVVRIKNKYICQKFADLRAVPEIKTNEDGKKEPTPVYLSFFYKVVKKGVLTIGFENINNDGFIDYEPLSYSQELDATATYQQLTISGLWNATGDFKLSFTGEMFVYMFVLSTDRIESLTHTYRTLFEQSERLVKISAAVFDKDEKALSETGLMIQPEGTGIYIKDANGKLALIGVGVEETDADGNAKTVIKLTADNIKLEGLVTANGYFRILDNGSVEATNGRFSGELNIYDKQGDGITVYDSDDIVRVNIQSDSIGDIAQMANDTYTYMAAYSDTEAKTFNNTAKTDSIGTLNTNNTIDIDNIYISTYGHGEDADGNTKTDYPSTNYGTLKIELLNDSEVVVSKLVQIQKVDAYGAYKVTDDVGIRYTIKDDGTYYVRYTVSGISSISSFQKVHLLVNARIQTSDVVQTLIGSDGFYSHTGANKLLWLDENELQFRFGFGGLRLSYPTSQSMKARFDTIAGMYGSTPNVKPVWVPFHNITPMFSPQFGVETETIVNTGATGKYTYKIDPFSDCGICYLDFPPYDANMKEQESWILLPSSIQTYNGNTIGLPRGYAITIINDTGNKVYVTGNVSFYHGCKIIDANNNENYVCSLNGTQRRDTYIYIGSYADSSHIGNIDRWIAMHDTQ